MQAGKALEIEPGQSVVPHGIRPAGRLAEWLRDPQDGELKRTFADWVRQMAEGFVPGDAEPASVRTLEGVRMTLEERVAEWPK